MHHSRRIMAALPGDDDDRCGSQRAAPARPDAGVVPRTTRRGAADQAGRARHAGGRGACARGAALCRRAGRRTTLRQLTRGGEVHARLGLIYFQQGKFAEAIAPLREALRLKPALPKVDALLAMSLSEIGRMTRRCRP